MDQLTSLNYQNENGKLFYYLKADNAHEKVAILLCFMITCLILALNYKHLAFTLHMIDFKHVTLPSDVVSLTTRSISWILVTTEHCTCVTENILPCEFNEGKNLSFPGVTWGLKKKEEENLGAKFSLYNLIASPSRQCTHI